MVRSSIFQKVKDFGVLVFRHLNLSDVYNRAKDFVLYRIKKKEREEEVDPELGLNPGSVEEIADNMEKVTCLNSSLKMLPGVIELLTQTLKAHLVNQAGFTTATTSTAKRTVRSGKCLLQQR